MKIRFRKNTNIRHSPLSLENEPLGIVYAGTVLDIGENFHDGAAIDGNNKWFRDTNGWYYWSGETEILLPVLPETPPATVSSPAPPPEAAEDAQLPAVTAFPATLPLPEEEHDPGIPEGETRPMPSPAAHIEPDGATEALESLTLPKEEAHEGFPPALTGITFTPPQPDSGKPASAGLLTPDPERLNWGVENYEIARHWWKERQLTGRGVTIALLSTGIALDHPDLAGAVSRTFNATDATEPPFDQHGLGTQAAVLAAGRGHTAFGVAPEASLLIGKIARYDQDITPENLLAGLNWATEAGAHIIALLVDFRELDETQKKNLEQAIALALDRNIVLLAPVGNSVERRPEDRFPASLEGVLSVGAHDIYGQRRAFSAKSYQLDLLAPGEGLLTSNALQQPTANLKTTAIATAFTAGFLALVRQWEIRHNRTIPPRDLIELLRSTAAAHKTITKGNDVEYGYGLLNPAELLNSLEQGNV